MSVNVGAISVSLGFNSAQFDAGMQKAANDASTHTTRMSANMKAATREGAESLTLVGEAIDLHIARPLARVVAQIPGVGSALASLGGATVGIAGGIAILGFLVAGVDKLSAAYEKAKQTQEEYAAAQERTHAVFADALADFEKMAKLASFTDSGLNKQLFQIDSSGMDKLTKSVNALADAIEKEAEAARKAHTWTTEMIGAIGDVASGIFGSTGDANAALLTKQIGSFKKTFDDLARTDALKGTHDSAKFLEDALDSAVEHMTRMREVADHMKGAMETTGGLALGAAVPGAPTKPVATVSQAELDAQQRYIEGLEKIAALSQSEAAATAAERYSAEVEKWTAALNKANEADLKWFDDQNKLTAQFKAVTAAVMGMSSVGDKFWKDQMASITAAVNLAGGLVQPTAGIGMSTSAQKENLLIQQNANEAYKEAQRVIDATATASDKYATSVQELDILLKQHFLNEQQYQAALAAVNAEYVKAETHLVKLQKQMQDLLLRTDSVSAGFQAFLVNLQINASETAKFTFDFLNAGLTGFEDQLANVLTNSKASWGDYLRSLEQMFLKFSMNRLLAGLLGGGSGGPPGPPPGATSPQTWSEKIGSALGTVLGGGGQAAGTTALATAAVSLNTAGVALTTAAGELVAAATALTATTASSDTGGFLSVLGGLGQMAGGGDVSPGSSYWVGEKGEPELFSPTTAGRLTPLSSLARGGGRGGNVTYVDARGASGADMEDRITRAIRASEDRAVVRSAATMHEFNRRTLGVS